MHIDEFAEIELDNEVIGYLYSLFVELVDLKVHYRGCDNNVMDTLKDEFDALLLSQKFIGLSTFDKVLIYILYNTHYSGIIIQLRKNINELRADLELKQKENQLLSKLFIMDTK